ncbi:MAG TPA: hypothetical protein VND64_17880 [Pirellulales bacterium]|nr:hypothetical protein [Pirellulales bacterium]
MPSNVSAAERVEFAALVRLSYCFWHVGQGESLFDLAADLAELRDLASQRRTRAQELRRQLAALVAFQQRWLAELEKKGTRNR